MLARVNDFHITKDQVKKGIASSVWASTRPATIDDFVQTLENEINKECLIQEAIKNELHKEEKFRKAIENYWAQTLITNILSKKMNELDHNIITTESELKEYFETKYKTQHPKSKYSDVKHNIMQLLIEDKKSKAIDEWIIELRKKSNVIIYRDNLEKWSE